MTEILRQSLVRLLYTLIGYLTFYTSFWERSDYLQDSLISNIRNRQNGVDSKSMYDFIVIGAGTSGSVVAHRLSEKYNVLLLEDGGDPFPLSHIPSFSLFLLNYPAIDWMHLTVPQSHAGLSLIDKVSGWSAGRNLGGTSNINFLIHSRGSPLDFDSWAAKVKDSQWNYENVLPFFKRSEDYHGEYEDSGYHGKGGPVRLEIPSGQKSADIYLKAIQELGYAKTDINGNFTTGFDKIYHPIKNGRRQGTFNAYIKPIRRRKSLTIQKFAHVNKIIVEGEKNDATAVEYERHGQIVRAYANKEIVLSAGAIQSPKLLMLSGIGPKKELESHNIEVKYDSPQVGQNLQDHISVYVGPFFVDAGSATADFPVPTFNFDRDIRFRSFLDFYLQGTGYLTSSGLETIGFVTVPSNNTKENDPWPNIQYLFSGINIYNEIAFRIFAKSFHIREDVIDKYYKHAVGREYFFVVTSLARPKQTGEIKLKSKNPRDQLHIDPKYLQNDEDLQTLISGVKNIIRIVETAPTFKKIGAKFTTQPFPGCENEEFRSEKYFECYVRQYTVTLHHIVGTASMGDKNGSGVVDPELKVNGVRKLRVIDASIMPHVVVGNTAAPCLMIGEKGSDLILSTYREAQNTTTDAQVNADMKLINNDKIQTTEQPPQTERIPLPVSTTSTPTTTSTTSSTSTTTTTTTTEEPTSSSSTSTTSTSTTPETETTTTSTTTTTSSTTKALSSSTTTMESILTFPVNSSYERINGSSLLDNCKNSTTKYVYLDIDERIAIPKKNKKNKNIRIRRQVKCPPQTQTPTQTDYELDIRSDYPNESSATNE